MQGAELMTGDIELVTDILAYEDAMRRREIAQMYKEISLLQQKLKYLNNSSSSSQSSSSSSQSSSPFSSNLEQGGKIRPRAAPRRFGYEDWSREDFEESSSSSSSDDEDGYDFEDFFQKPLAPHFFSEPVSSQSSSFATSPQVNKFSLNVSPTIGALPLGGDKSNLVHGLNRGLGIYFCKHCENSWPCGFFRNTQQFGAHCSNCSRQRKVKHPHDLNSEPRPRSVASPMEITRSSSASSTVANNSSSGSHKRSNKKKKDVQKKKRRKRTKKNSLHLSTPVANKTSTVSSSTIISPSSSSSSSSFSPTKSSSNNSPSKRTLSHSKSSTFGTSTTSTAGRRMKHGCDKDKGIYYCKHCENSWPIDYFRNPQQFGAHCSNCSRQRQVRDPRTTGELSSSQPIIATPKVMKDSYVTIPSAIIPTKISAFSPKKLQSSPTMDQHDEGDDTDTQYSSSSESLSSEGAASDAFSDVGPGLASVNPFVDDIFRSSVLFE